MRHFGTVKRVVVKIGSALITNHGQGLAHQAIQNWVQQITRLDAVDTVLVSSGAVAAGRVVLGWSERPREIYKLQAAAAVGQTHLVQTYEDYFRQQQRHCAQILLTHADVADRQRYLNARRTLITLLELNVVPIVNENDTVATDEIRFGDNDTLAASVANLIEADLLIILTDQQGVFDHDPSLQPDAELIQSIDCFDPQLDEVAGPSQNALGRGGMLTKIMAARQAAHAGTQTVIAHGLTDQILSKVIQGQPEGTWLQASQKMTARKRWLAGHKIAGQVRLDQGAVSQLQHQGASLLAIGIQAVKGQFERGDLITCEYEGREIARGLSNYSSQELQKLKGQHSDLIAEVLGYVAEPEVIHRDNLVLNVSQY